HPADYPGWTARPAPRVRHRDRIALRTGEREAPAGCRGLEDESAIRGVAVRVGLDAVCDRLDHQVGDRRIDLDAAGQVDIEAGVRHAPDVLDGRAAPRMGRGVAHERHADVTDRRRQVFGHEHRVGACGDDGVAGRLEVSAALHLKRAAGLRLRLGQHADAEVAVAAHADRVDAVALDAGAVGAQPLDADYAAAVAAHA